jgi:glycosyltransferase involved in cell wall biosynthesis
VDRICLLPLLNSSWPLDRLLGDFTPQAVLTVGHGPGCLVAARYAMRKSLPLHLLAHDDVKRFLLGGAAARRSAEARFAETYRYASSRLCVSPSLEQVYRDRYGVAGTILYPSRGYDTPVFDTPSSGPAPAQPLVVGFAGNVFSKGQLRLLVKASEVLARMGGKFLMFGPHDKSHLEGAGMNPTSTVFRGTLSSPELIRALRAEAHALLLPWTFEPDEAAELVASFPSKLTDYTATGLPILAWGPPDNPVDRWLKNLPETMVGITTESGEALLHELVRLLDHPERRLELGRQALLAGQQFFSPDVAARKFEAALATAAVR